MEELEKRQKDVIGELQSRIEALENENLLLKKRLDEVGISYADIVTETINENADIYDPDQGARIKRFEVTDKTANDFFMMLCRGRMCMNFVIKSEDRKNRVLYTML